MRKTKTGLVLSGGGYRGIAHAGAIKALEEFSIVPDYISGTSAGALVGALYAANYSPKEILEFFKKVKIFEISRYARNKPGWIDTDTFRSFLQSYFPENNFSTLSKKLFITTTNLLTGQIKVFSTGALINALLASASFPGVFSPITMENGLYADGGILDNFPVEPIKSCNQLYGVYVSPINIMKANDFKHSYDVVNRALQLRMNAMSLKKFKDCNLVIYPQQLSQFNLLNSKNTDKIFDIGYNYTKAYLKKKALNSTLKINEKTI